MRRREFISKTAFATGAVIAGQGRKSFASELLLQSRKNAFNRDAIPNLDELAGIWMAGKMLEQTPALANFHGSLQASRNVLGVQFFTVPPLAQGGELAALRLNGTDIPAEEYRWFPYQVQRRATQQGLKILTTLRMPFEQSGILFDIDIENTAAKPCEATLTIDLRAAIRHYPGTWEWETPRPGDRDWESFETGSMKLNGEQILYTKDTQSENAAGFVFSPGADKLSPAADDAAWTVKLKPGERFSLQGVMACGPQIGSAAGLAAQWKTNFVRMWEQAQVRWQQRWLAVFDPNNTHFSGSLPTLTTPDAAIRKLYYAGVLSLLCLERTNFGPRFPRVFVTGSPQWATNMMYFWDTSFEATLLALLDPEVMKQLLKLFLASNIHSGYAIDFLSMKIVGPWYSANDYSVFRLVMGYLDVTGDGKFLDEPIKDDKRVIDYLEESALYWQKLSSPATLLANYGDASNLLECVPTYINCVPSMNAANVWMMRSVARIRNLRGETDRARELNQLADRLAEAVLSLYVNGKGFWACQMTDGKKVEVRHCIDFFTTIDAMKSDLGAQRIEEMIAFVNRELWTPHWLRALSLSDETARECLRAEDACAGSFKEPTRADHGYTGSYDAWPALTAEAIFAVGRKREALERFRSVVQATHEGPYGQAHYVATGAYPVRKALSCGQDYFCAAAGSFAEVILRTVFGFSPAVGEDWSPGSITAPGFEGQLKNLRYGGKLMTVSVHEIA